MRLFETNLTETMRLSLESLKNEAENAIAPTEGYCVYCYFSHITTASRNKLPLCLKITALSLLLICHVISLASYL